MDQRGTRALPVPNVRSVLEVPPSPGPNVAFGGVGRYTQVESSTSVVTLPLRRVLRPQDAAGDDQLGDLGGAVAELEADDVAQAPAVGQV